PTRLTKIPRPSRDGFSTEGADLLPLRCSIESYRVNSEGSANDHNNYVTDEAARSGRARRRRGAACGGLHRTFTSRTRRRRCRLRTGLSVLRMPADARPLTVTDVDRFTEQ